MDETRSAWQEASDQLSGLGRRLKEHYRDQHGEENSATEAVRHLAEAVQDAFDAMGTAAKDPQVQAEVKQVGRSLSDALGTTFAEVSEDLRQAFRSGAGDEDSPAPTDRSSGTGTDGEPEEEPPRVEPWGTP
jgi:hypothetical protein